MNKYWVALSCAITGITAFAIGFGTAIHINPLTADRYLLNLGSMGDWVSGIGALMAVVVTLWLAHRQSVEDTERLQVSAQMVLIAGYGAPTSFLQFGAISNGKRPSNLTSFGLKSKHATNILAIVGFSNVSHPIPATLQYGQSWNGWMALEQMSDILGFVERDCAGNFDGLQVYANTTLGTFSGVLHGNVIQALRGMQQERQAAFGS